MPTTSPSVGCCAGFERAEVANLRIGENVRDGVHRRERQIVLGKDLIPMRAGVGPDDLSEFFSQAHVVLDAVLARLEARIGCRACRGP